MYYFDKDAFYNFKDGDEKNFCLANGLGGYVSQSIINSAYRKHHGYLVACLKPPVSRMLVLARINESVEIGNHFYDLEAQAYTSGIKEGQHFLADFTYDYTPTFFYQVDGVTIKKKIAPLYGANTVAISYEIVSHNKGTIYLEPLFNYRDHGGVSNIDDLRFTTTHKNKVFTLIPDRNKDVKIKFSYSEGSLVFNEKEYTDPLIYGYDQENGDKRLDYHYKPIKLKIDLKANEVKFVSVVVTTDRIPVKDAFGIIIDYETRIESLVRQAKINDSLGKNLVVSADTFLCYRESTGLETILAGLPWFTDWGRDTMIAFTGLTLVTKRFKEAKEILLSFSKYEHHGLIPNMFPDDGGKPLYNTVDASLWYFYAVYKYIEYTGDYAFIKDNIYPVLKKIIKSYKEGTDFSIYMDTDYLIHAGSDLDQITWMDVRVNDLVVTPRHGKPCEINALWYNALMIIGNLSKHFGEDPKEYYNLADKTKKSFNKRFFCEKTGCLYDTVDPDDASVRPNQIWVLSLPFKVLDEKYNLRVFKVVENELYNVYGLRSLSPKDPRFKPFYRGELMDRDLAYHMGTTWAFLIGGYLDSYHYVFKNDPDCKLKIKKMVQAFVPHLNDGCINGVSEIFDGLKADKSKGCYTQAWSVGELLRAYYENVLQE